MFHVELRQFPHQARAFNLTREELHARILQPWVAGEAVALEERRWLPDKARLTVYEGPKLGSDQLGLGRGWANVTREGHDVTAALLAEVKRPPAVSAFKAEVLARCAGETVSIGELVELAGERYPQSRVSERIALCEQAVWELLHEGTVQLVCAGDRVDPHRWQDVLLGWDSWSGQHVVLKAAG